jgi:hypothetical protein
MDQELKQIKPSQVFGCMVDKLGFTDMSSNDSRPIKQMKSRIQVTTYPERRLRIVWMGSEHKTSISAILTQMSHRSTSIDQDYVALRVFSEQPGFDSFVLEKTIRLPSTEEEFISLMKKAIADLKQIHAVIIAL